MSTTKKTSPSQSISQWVAVPLVLVIIYWAVMRMGTYVNDDEYRTLLTRSSDPAVLPYTTPNSNLGVYYLGYMNCGHGECDIGVLVDNSRHTHTLAIIARRSRWNANSEILCEETIPLDGVLATRPPGEDDHDYAQEAQDQLVTIIHNGRCSPTDDFEGDSDKTNRAILRALTD